MNKKAVVLIGFFLVSLSFTYGQTNEKLIELGIIYKDYMFRNEPSKSTYTELKAGVSEDVREAADFIAQTITPKNKLLTQQFLSRPDNRVLKQLFIIKAINLNIREENQVDNNQLIDSLNSTDIPVYELIDNYYGMLFTAVGNKNQPFNLSKTDLKLNQYNLKDNTEKGILFLRCMDYCGTVIWGYINVVNPPNTQKAYSHIKKYPRVNGQLYYQYTDLYFSDFEMNIIKDKGIQSYKSHYLDKYYETLLSHFVCLIKENKTEKEKNDLLLGSILKEKNLYKYTQYGEILEGIFQEQ